MKLSELSPEPVSTMSPLFPLPATIVLISSTGGPRPDAARPPPSALVFPANVELRMIAPLWGNTPPPLPEAVLPLMVEFSMTRRPSLSIAPPDAAWLPSNVLLKTSSVLPLPL